MRFTKQEALDLAKSAPELLAAELPGGGALPWGDVPLLRSLTGLEADRAQAGEATASVEEYDQEITFRDGHRMPARVYRPAQTRAGGCPLMVSYHAGGWVTGSYMQGAVSFRRLADVFKMVVVTLPYRLAPEHVFPTSQLDAYDGLKWASQNASSLGADLTKGFVVAGASAGGQLAAVCAQHWVQEKKSPPLTGLYLQIAWILGPSQVPERYRDFYNSPEQEEIKQAPVLNTNDVHLLDTHLVPDIKSDWHSPFMASAPHMGMPPTYFQLSGQDPLRDHSLIYEDALKEAGVETKLDVYPGLFHAFPLFLPNTPQSVQFVNDQIKGFAFLLGKDEAEFKQHLV